MEQTQAGASKHVTPRSNLIDMNNGPVPRRAIMDDFAPWLSLAREVEPLFGPMSGVPEFRQALEIAITDGKAFCVSASPDEGAGLLGGIVVSISDNRIEWLAVSATARGRGYGKALLAFALERLDRRRPVSVQTFASDCRDGIPARRLYQDFGFLDAQASEPTPTGIPTVLMTRPAREALP